MLTLLKPWRNLQTDLKHPSQTWEEAFSAFCAVASPRDLRIISNIQYFHKCKDGAKRCRGGLGVAAASGEARSTQGLLEVWQSSQGLWKLGEIGRVVVVQSLQD